jgi:hypothetical protein
MLHRTTVRMFLFALCAMVVSGTNAGAAPVAGAQVEGVITSIDLSGSPRQIVVKTGSGEQVPVRIHQSTRVVFHTSAPGVAPEIGSLQAGMHVRVKYPGDKPAERIHVTEIPSDALAKAQAQGGVTSEGGFGNTSGRELKVRVIDVDTRRGELRADVAGQSRQFQVDDPKLLARLDEGDMVILTLDRAGSTRVTDVRSASLFGRVTDVSGNRVRVMVDGREETFTFDAERKGLRRSRVRVGDEIRFEAEERPGGERVITQIEAE